MRRVAKTVLITGATGNIGAKLTAFLRETGGYDLRLVCLNPKGEPGVHTADLSTYDEAWASEFEGVDTVIHLAADPNPHAGWASLQSLNLDLMFNVMAACQLKGVRRVIFASSNHVMGGYRFGNEWLTTDMVPNPGNNYGATKLMGERLGKMFFERHGLSFIAFRIGAFPKGENSRPHTGFNASRWGLGMWLSDRDLFDAFQRAIDDETIGFGVYNLVSANAGTRWDLDSLKRDLGFVPRDGVATDPDFKWRIKQTLAWLRRSVLPRLAERVGRRHW